MSAKYTFLILAGVSCVVLSGCDSKRNTEPEHFWQRSRVTEATYMNGPKAQQFLNRDIARCVTELRELDSLEAIREATPAETKENGMVPDPSTPQGKLDGWDTPERDAYLIAEHLDYADFESCMYTKGWDRLEHVPYDTADSARITYEENRTGKKNYGIYSRPDMMPEKSDDFSSLND